MRNTLSRATNGRAGVIIGIVALVAALGGSAIALPGKNSVDSGDIKNGQVKTKDMKIATLFIDNPSGVRSNAAVVAIDKPAGDQVYCLQLSFKPKTGSATRSANAASFAIPEIAIGTLAASLCGAGYEAAVQVPGQPTSDGTYANFIG